MRGRPVYGTITASRRRRVCPSVIDHASDPLWLAAIALAMATTGLAAGLLNGLFGVGGGVVIVPVMSYALPLLGVDAAVQQKLAVATSLATVVPATGYAAWRHHVLGAVDRRLLGALLPSLAAGSLIGAGLLLLLRGEALALIFALVALGIAAHFAVTGESWRLGERLPEGMARQAIGAAMGAVSVVMGIGGGTIGVPVMTMFGAPIRAAVATASVFGIIVSVPGTLAAIAGGWGDPRLPPLSLGFVSLPGFALIVPASLLAIPWGVRLAHRLRPLVLKRLFALFFLAVGLRMLARALA